MHTHPFEISHFSENLKFPFFPHRTLNSQTDTRSNQVKKKVHTKNKFPFQYQVQFTVGGKVIRHFYLI